MQSVIEQLKDFNPSENKKYSFYAKPYVEWSMECREIQLGLMFDNENSIENI